MNRASANSRTSQSNRYELTVAGTKHINMVRSLVLRVVKKKSCWALLKGHETVKNWLPSKENHVAAVGKEKQKWDCSWRMLTQKLKSSQPTAAIFKKRSSKLKIGAWSRNQQWKMEVTAVYKRNMPDHEKNLRYHAWCGWNLKMEHTEVHRLMKTRFVLTAVRSIKKSSHGCGCRLPSSYFYG